MIKFKISGLEKNRVKLADALKVRIDEEKRRVLVRIRDRLRDATPVDTGYARSRWEIVGNTIVNDADYISELNQGSSKQAPSNFIEKTILSIDNTKLT